MTTIDNANKFVSTKTSDKCSSGSAVQVDMKAIVDRILEEADPDLEKRTCCREFLNILVRFE